MQTAVAGKQENQDGGRRQDGGRYRPEGRGVEQGLDAGSSGEGEGRLDRRVPPPVAADRLLETPVGVARGVPRLCIASLRP